MENPVEVVKRPLKVLALQWTNNEPFIRRFVGDDTLIHFTHTGELEIWSSQENCWINCPMFHWIIKGIKGEFYPCSPEVFERTYDTIKESPKDGPN